MAYGYGYEVGRLRTAGIYNQKMMSDNHMPLGVQQSNISNINQINSSFVNNIVEIGEGGGYSSLPIVQNYLMWIYAGLK